METNPERQEEIKFKNFYTEFGLSYPIAISTHKAYFGAYLNLGIDKKLRNGFIIGGHLFGAYDQDYTRDFNFGFGTRIGLISKNKLIYGNYGLIVASDKYNKFPGYLFGLNMDILNKGGIHVRYKNMGIENNENRRVIELGLHTSTNYTNKYSVKVLGTVGIITLLVISIISSSS